MSNLNQKTSTANQLSHQGGTTSLTASTGQLSNFFTQVQHDNDKHRSIFIKMLEMLAVDNFADALVKPIKITSEEFANHDFEFYGYLNEGKLQPNTLTKTPLIFPFCYAWKKYFSCHTLTTTHAYFQANPKYLHAPGNLANSKARKGAYKDFKYDVSLDNVNISQSNDVSDQSNVNSGSQPNRNNTTLDMIMESEANNIIDDVEQSCKELSQKTKDNNNLQMPIPSSKSQNFTEASTVANVTSNLISNPINFRDRSASYPNFQGGLQTDTLFQTQNQLLNQQLGMNGMSSLTNSSILPSDPLAPSKDAHWIAQYLDQRLNASNESMNRLSTSLTNQFQGLDGRLTKMQESIETTTTNVVNKKFQDIVQPAIDKLEQDSQETNETVNELKDKVNSMMANSASALDWDLNTPVEVLYSESKRLRADYEMAVAQEIEKAILTIDFNNIYLNWLDGKASIKSNFGDFIGCKYEVIEDWYRRGKTAYSAKIRLVKSDFSDDLVKIAKEIVKKRASSKGLGINFVTPRNFDCVDDFKLMVNKGLIKNWSKGRDNKYYVVTKGNKKIFPNNPIEFCKIPWDQNFEENATKCANYTEYFTVRGKVYRIPDDKAKMFKEKRDGREFVIATWSETAGTFRGKPAGFGYDPSKTPKEILEAQKINYIPGGKLPGSKGYSSEGPSASTGSVIGQASKRNRTEEDKSDEVVNMTDSNTNGDEA